MLTLELNFDEKNKVGITRLVGDGTIIIKTMNTPLDMYEYMHKKKPDLIKVQHSNIMNHLGHDLMTSGFKYEVNVK